MDYRHSVDFLYALGNEHKTGKLGLERIVELLHALGDPHIRPGFLHVAGTNGKGSTCAMIESGLRASGRRTGLYTSPHLQQPTERIQIDGSPIPEQDFVRVFEVVRDTAGAVLRQQATYFETITAMAFVSFAERNVDFVALEVGLGGRLDATNVVKPDVCAITPIDFDHESWLGNTIEAIAAEKAGILKPGVPAVVAPQRPEAEQVILGRAREIGASVVRTSEWQLDALELGPAESRFKATRESTLRICCPLPGEHQVTNALTAIAVLDTLGVPAASIESGIAQVRWPGRLERVSILPEIWLDGAHNPAGARTLARHIQRFFTSRKLTMIFGAMRDKAVPEIAAMLFPLADRLVLTAPRQPRALDPHLIADLTRHSRFRITKDVGEAISLCAGDDLVLITGSLYLVGEARELLVK
jgi:dihydrofolate synthase / folylpolyglutamate synthase